WTWLTETFQPHSRARALMLHDKFIAIKLKPDETIGTYISRVTDITVQISEIDAPIGPLARVGVILRGLPPEYEAARAHIASMPSVTDTDILSILTDRETTLSQEKLRGSNTSTALAFQARAVEIAKKELAAEARSREKGCHPSQKPKNKRKPTTGQRRQKASHAKLTCHNCNEVGHIRPNCPALSNRTRIKMNKQTETYFSSCFLGTTQPPCHRHTFILDSGASGHMCDPDLSSFPGHITTYPHSEAQVNVTCGGGAQLPAIMAPASLAVSCKIFPAAESHTTLMVVPGLGANLLSLGKLVDEGITAYFGVNSHLRRTSDGAIFPLTKRGNLYYLQVSVHWKQPNSRAMVARIMPAIEWHKRLGHCSPIALRLLALKPQSGVTLSEADLTKLSLSARTSCVTCITCKGTHRPRNTRQPKSPATKPLERVHCDLWGPTTPLAPGGVQYLIVFSCEATRFKRVYGLANKNDAHLALRAFQMHYAAPRALRISYLRSDSEAVFTGASSLFKRACADFGIRLERSPPYVKNANGKAERDWRSILEMTRCCLHEAPHLPKSIWLEAAKYSSYTLCMLPLSRLGGVSPQEKFQGITPDLSYLRPFGCKALVRLENHQRDDKLSPVAFTGYMVGYDYDCPTYRIYKPPLSGKGFGTIISTKHVTFLEEAVYPPVVTTQTGPSPDTTITDPSVGDYPTLETSGSAATPDATVEPSSTPVLHVHPELRDHNTIGNDPGSSAGNHDAHALPSHTLRSGNSYGIAHHCHEFDNNPLFAGIEHAFITNHLPSVSSIKEPCSLKEALASSHADEWRQAMNEELASLKANNTWTLVKAPLNANVIKTKWVYKVKYTAEGSIARFKARLVVQGFTQRLGVDYTDTHAPVSRLTTIRFVLALATRNDWDIYALDIKCAYLQAPVNEDIYVRAPPGYDSDHASDGSPLVGKLNRSLYGLKQAGLNWFTEFTTHIASLGFTPLHTDRCVFLLPSLTGGQPRVILVLYVDDILLTGPDTAALADTRCNILDRFEGSDLGDLRLYMGIRFTRDRSHHTLRMDQSKYIQDVLIRFNMMNCNPVPIPATSGSTKEPGGDSEPLPADGKCSFQALTGALIWLVVCTRPDLAYAVNLLSRAVASPTKAHAGLGKRILRYLKGTIDKELIFDFRNCYQSPLFATSYVDADFAESPDRRSTTGYLHRLGSAAIAWGSKRQTLVTKSTAEAEYVALSYAGSDALHFGRLLSELTGTPFAPVCMYEDNASAIALAQGTVHKSRAKHIDIHFHWIRDRINKRHLIVKSIDTHQQLADIFTKGLPKPAFTTM
ncbi:unnamed protein product, partial [Chrysoparadoxa australica]